MKRVITASLFWITSKVRPIWLLKVVRLINSERVTYFFDPNNIRRFTTFDKPALQVQVCHSEGLGKFIVDLNDHIGFIFFIRGHFDDALVWASQYLGITEEDAICDIGANVGTVSIPCAVQKNCEVIAFEASWKTCAVLLENFSNNRVKAKLFPVCILSPEDLHENRWTTLYLNSGNHGANSTFDDWNPGNAPPKEQICPTNYVEGCLSDEDIERIKLIKIDIEGAEDKAIRGLARLRKKSVPILMEYRLDLTASDRVSVMSEMIDILEETYEIYALSKLSDGAYKLCDFDRSKSYENILAMPQLSE